MVDLQAQTCRPLRKDAERNRQRILAVARTLFAERGMAVSHDQLAEAADVAVGTVYRRFPDKDSLLESLFNEDIDHVERLARSALELDDPWAGLVAFLTESLELQAGNRGFKEFLMYNVTSEAMTACRYRLLPLLDELVVRGHAAGVLRPDITTVDLGMIPIMMGPVMDGCRDVSPDLWRRTLQVVMDGLRPATGRQELPSANLDAEEIFEVMRCSHIAPGRK